MAAVVLFSTWFYAVLVLYSAVVIPLLSLFVVICRPFCSRRHAMKIFRSCIRLYGRGVVAFAAGRHIQVRYRDYAGAGEQKPFVYACSHRSSSDAFLMSLVRGELVQVVNKWPFRLPVLGWFAKLAGYINVREMSFEAFKAEVGAFLEQGVSVLAFPEGTRSASRKTGQFHGALFRACLEFGATIVPVCIMGNEDTPRRGSLLLHPALVRVHRLPGLSFDEYKDMSPFALKNRVRSIIQNHILETEGEVHGTGA